MWQGTDDRCFRIIHMRSKSGLEPVALPASGRIDKVHGCVIAKVSFSDCDPGHARHFHQQWQSEKVHAGNTALVGKGADGQLDELTLIHGTVMGQNQSVSRGVLAETKLS